MEVIVDDSQLSLAIGKKGQNVRLAAKLLGWKIDIKSEEEKRQEVESQMAALVAPGRSGVGADGLRAERRGGGEIAGSRRRHHREAGRHDARAARRDPGHRSGDRWSSFRRRSMAYYSQFEDPGTAAPEESEAGAAAEDVGEVGEPEAGEAEVEAAAEE